MWISERGWPRRRRTPSSRSTLTGKGLALPCHQVQDHRPPEACELHFQCATAPSSVMPVLQVLCYPLSSLTRISATVSCFFLIKNLLAMEGLPYKIRCPVFQSQYSQGGKQNLSSDRINNLSWMEIQPQYLSGCASFHPTALGTCLWLTCHTCNHTPTP